ncbi:hypothetical protein GCM10009665_41690 [Kitasatospora nipponensis]|uniref:UspA domain-containing protein n=1 Tax=Kitasatospora nipponensis TaxID=258049 RepID=A0ABP4H0P7_9ACTN
MIEEPRVVVGVNDTLSSLAALHRAVDEARARGAQLVPVAAWSGGTELRPVSELEYAAHERLATAFDQAFGGLPGDLTVLPLVVRDLPGPALTRIADRPGDLLVLGCGHRGRREPARQSSTVRHCLTHATCALLVVDETELLESLEAAVGLAPARVVITAR